MMTATAGRSGFVGFTSRKGKNMRGSNLCLMVVGALLVTCGTAAAQFTVDINIDEFGHGTITNSAGFNGPLAAALLPDPGPGGLPAALTYSLDNPPGLTAGDLLLVEPGGGGLLTDQIRFNPQETASDGTTGTVLIYSDHFDGPDSLADNGFPTALYANTFSLNEVGPEPGPNGVDYTPTAGQPGFVAGAAGPVTYHITSDGSPSGGPGTPLPASAWSGVALLTGLGAWRVIRRRATI